MYEYRSKNRFVKHKYQNPSNYQGLDHSIYQAPVFYQVQSDLQAIVYLKFQHLPQPLPQLLPQTLA